MLTALRLLMCFEVVSLLYIFIRAWRKRRLRGGLPLPPGPKGLPILGNVLDLDVSEPWLSYTEWAKKYGDLFYSTILGQEFVVINSEELAHALLEQRSKVYSDKPYIYTKELFGMDFNTSSLSYGDEWRQHRKMLHAGLRKEVSHKYQPMQLQKVHRFLENLIASPAQFPVHTRTLTAAIVMAVTYGYDVASVEDRFVTKVEGFLHLFLQGFTPKRAALTAAIPFLRYIPSWLPGGRYKRRAGESRSLARDVLNDPVMYVKDEMAGGTTRQSLVKDLLDRYTAKDNVLTVEDENTVKAVAASAFLAGVETTDSVIHVFLLAMILHPEVQIKAQEEIDKVVGDGRLPDFSDREHLPYVEAVYLETLRWRPTAPMPSPHVTSTSDVYNGYYIPKGADTIYVTNQLHQPPFAGAIIIINAWAMTHDETRFPDSMSFKPERHLSPTGELLQGPAVTSSSFGFGPRQCPGKYLADQSVWATVVSTLATLRIGKGKDSTGCEINVKPEFTTGVVVRPKPFTCSVEPRSAVAERLIRASNRGE
ncbi:cytochrome P450 [Rhizopogon salebrosus TDB-379]|nr:cytochrome P450 [Rhizopogon salebrosus TDB-379]